MKRATIALIGDYDPSVTAHQAIPRALALAGDALGGEVTGEWIGTERLAGALPDALTSASGVWCVPASPYRSEAGALAAIRFARESGRPFLGTCGGFQHAVLEYARNVLGIVAGHQETDGADHPALVISALSCSLVEVRGDVVFPAGSPLREWYGAESAAEGYHCSYGLNPRYEERLTAAGFRVLARDAAGDVRALELPDHPFYVLTLFQPERAALAGAVPPVVRAFVAAALAPSQVNA